MKYSATINALTACLLLVASSAVNAEDVRSKSSDAKYWDYQYANEQAGVAPSAPPPEPSYRDRGYDNYNYRGYRTPPPPPPRERYQDRRATAPTARPNCISGFRAVSDGRGNFRCESQVPRCPGGLGFQAVVPPDSGGAQKFQYRCFRPEG